MWTMASTRWELPLTVQRWPNKEQVRLSRFIKDRLDCSQAVVKEQIHKGLCRVNGAIERFASRQLVPGDLVELIVQAKPEVEKPAILFEDEWLIAYNKPAFMKSEDLESAGKTLIHRLDKETSGVILLAKTEEAKEALMKAFRAREVQKEYLALVEGVVKPETGELKGQIAPLTRFKGQVLMGLTKKGSYAETHFKVKKRFSKTTLLICSPKTGRTHQIRVQMRAFGHPLVGDYSYGATRKAPRVLLHAASLQFVHPLDKAEKIIHAPTPADFKDVMKNEDRNR